MRITDEHIATLKQQRFVIIENFLTEEERKSALEGIFTFVASPFEQWLANGKKTTIEKPQHLFPWDHSGLNHVFTHPDVIDAAERIIGTHDLRLCEGSIGPKYYEGGNWGSAPDVFHIDYGNNTLGPLMENDDFQHIYFFFIFDDVKEGMAPIQMVPHGKQNEEAVKFIAPGGSVCIYTPFTTHAASTFMVPGHRFTSWIGYSRKDRPWDGGRTFAYKTGASYPGMGRFIAEASPRQLELLGFPPVGDPLWTPEFIEGMRVRYKGFNPEPYLEHLQAVK